MIDDWSDYENITVSPNDMTQRDDDDPQAINKPASEQRYKLAIVNSEDLYQPLYNPFQQTTNL